MGVFGFLKGNNAAKEEEKQQKQEELKKVIESYKNNITIENMAIAFSCPFRSDFTEGSDLRLFEFGAVEGKNLEKFKKVIFRDFDVMDADSLDSTLSDWESSLEEENDLETTIFIHSVYLYIITSAVELGYVDIKDYTQQVKLGLKVIALNEEVTSWKRFGQLFVDGDYINDRAFHKRVFNEHCENLANSETSPWGVFEWKKVIQFIESL